MTRRASTKAKPAIAAPAAPVVAEPKGRAVWKGTITFGMTAIPVKLYSATEENDIKFKQVHVGPKGEIGFVKMKRISSLDGKEVSYADIQKGYETEDGSLVVLTKEHMESLPLSTIKAINVVDFVPRSAVEDVYLERTYTMTPEANAVGPYALLVQALANSGKVGIAKLALRQREQLGMLTVRNGRLSLTTLRWDDEVREMPDASYPTAKPEEIALATELIEALSHDSWDPSSFTDNYRLALEQVIAKVCQDEPVEFVEVVEPEPAVDMIAALRASVEAAKRARLEREAVAA